MSAVRHPNGTRPRVVVAGGGIAGLETLVALRSMAGHAVDLALIAPADVFSLRALAVFEPFGIGHPRAYPLDGLAAELDVRFHRDAVRCVDRPNRLVALQSGASLPYDELVVAVGAIAYPAFDHGVMFDRPGDPEAFDETLADLRANLAERIAIVVPPGATWTLPAYELALLVAADVRSAEVTLVTPEAEPLQAFGPPASAMARDELDAAGVALVCGARADVTSHAVVELGGQGRLVVDRVVHLPVLSGPGLRGLPADREGFILVDDEFRVAGDDRVHAIGDGIASPYKQGGLASQQADVVASGIAARVGADRRPIRYAPVLRALLRTANGPRYLRAAPLNGRGTCTVSDQCLWWPPSKVASRWLVPWLAARDLEGAPTVMRVLPSGAISRRVA